MRFFTLSLLIAAVAAYDSSSRRRRLSNRNARFGEAKTREARLRSSNEAFNARDARRLRSDSPVVSPYNEEPNNARLGNEFAASDRTRRADSRRSLNSKARLGSSKRRSSQAKSRRSLNSEARLGSSNRRDAMTNSRRSLNSEARLGSSNRRSNRRNSKSNNFGLDF